MGGRLALAGGLVLVCAVAGKWVHDIDSPGVATGVTQSPAAGPTEQEQRRCDRWEAFVDVLVEEEATCFTQPYYQLNCTRVIEAHLAAKDSFVRCAVTGASCTNEHATLDTARSARVDCESELLASPTVRCRDLLDRAHATCRRLASTHCEAARSKICTRLL